MNANSNWISRGMVTVIILQENSFSDNIMLLLFRFKCSGEYLFWISQSFHFVVEVWDHRRRSALIIRCFQSESTADLARTLAQSCFIIQSCKPVIGQSTPALGCVSH